MMTAASTLPFEVSNSSAMGRPSGVPGPMPRSTRIGQVGSLLELLLLGSELDQQIGLLDRGEG